MYFQYHRNLFHSRRKVPGSYRVLCMGDSLTFGAGVEPDETLPAKLEQILNRASYRSIVEVLNDGVSGYSLHDAWQRFIERGQHQAPDLAVAILCDNDAELFSVSQLADKNVSYEEHVANCWSDNGPHFDHFRLTLKEMAEYSQREGIPFIVTFYMIYTSPQIEKIARILKGLCQDFGLGWLDLSTEFNGGALQAPVSRWHVSSEDGHPSAEAHEIAAQSLARHIMACGYLSSDLPMDFYELDMANRVLDYARDAIAAGAPPETALYRAGQMLSAKRTSKSRLKIKSEKRADDGSYAQFIDSINLALDLNAQVTFGEAYAELLEQGQYQYFARSEELNTALHQLGRKVNMLGHWLEKPSVWLFPTVDQDDNKPASEQLNQAVERVRLRLEHLRSLRGILNGQTRFINGELAGWRAEQNCRRELARNRITQLWDDITKCCESFMDLYHRLARLAHASAGPPSQKWKAAFMELVGEMAQTGFALDQLFLEFRLDLFPQKWPSGDHTPYSEILVRCRSNHPAKFTLGIQYLAKVPQRPPIYDCRWVIRDGQDQIYHFKFPYFNMGQILLVRPPDTHLDIQDVRLFLNKERMLTIPGGGLHTTNQNGVLNTGLVMLPL